MTGLRGRPGHFGVCEVCGKHSFINRQLAKKMARQIDRTMRVYPCPETPNTWHMGHLSSVIIAGDADRRTWYGSKVQEDPPEEEEQGEDDQ